MTIPVHAALRLASVGGLPEDDIVWDFVFELATFNSGDADDIATSITSFCNTDQTNPGDDFAVADFVNGSISRATDAMTIDMYDLSGHLDGSPVGSPDFTRSFTLGPQVTEAALLLRPLPNEVACCLAYHADETGIVEISGATRPAARRRGRVYIGPLNNYAGSPNANGQLVPNGDLRDTLKNAGAFLMGELDNGWRVWSRADAAVREVVGGYVDNAFDTIRKRGVGPTARTTFGV